MDIGKSFSFVFEDKKWLEKVLIGGLITLLTAALSWTVIVGVVGGALLLGYGIELVRNTRRNEPEPLPEWNDWGEKIVEGIKLFAIYIIWALPLIIVSIPTGILTGVSGDSDFAGLVSFCFSCLAAIYGVVLFLASPAITIRFAETGEFSSGLEFSNILAFTRRHIGDVIIAVLVVWAVSLFAGLLGIILCGIGIFFTGFWATLVQYHLYAQIGLEEPPVSVSESETLLPPGPPEDIEPETIEATDVLPAGVRIGHAITEADDMAVEGAADEASESDDTV